MFHAKEQEKKGKKSVPNCESYMVFSLSRSPQVLHTGRRTWHWGRWPMRKGAGISGREAVFYWAGAGYPAPGGSARGWVRWGRER